ncbi:MFS transporter [Sphingobium sp. R-7]|uniref:MFS transporter n=1 Tax=Sphingobium sp. R-7 TaxID=3375449 RepID=UPI00398B1CFA
MDRRRISIFLCALAQNIAFGSLYGSFGPLLPSTVAKFDISLVTATMAMSVVTLAIAGSAPFAGILIQRTSIRAAMSAAAATSALCFVAIALATSYTVVLVAYGILGMSAVVLGIIGPVSLVNRLFESGRGRVLGLIHMPLLLMVAPIVIAELLPLCGRAGILFGIAALFAAIAPFLLTLIPSFSTDSDPDRPSTDGPADSEDPKLGKRSMFALVPLSLSVGVIAAGSVVYMAHIVPFGLGRGMTLASASLLISLYSGFGVAGSPVAGWVADRIGAYWTLALAAVLIGVIWILLPATQGPIIFVAASLLGFFAAPINTMHAAAVSTLFDAAKVGRAMGISYLFKLPILVSAAPLVAFAVGQYQSYNQPFILLAMITFLAAGLAVSASAIARQPRSSPTIP